MNKNVRVKLVNNVEILTGTMEVISVVVPSSVEADYKALLSGIGHSHNLAAFQLSGYKNIDI